MTRTMLLLVAAAVVATTVVTATPANACSCIGYGERRLAAKADAVFIGAIENVQRPDKEKNDSNLITWTFAVDAVFKGEVARTQTIVSEPSGMCGYEFNRGARHHLVFAYQEGDDLHVNLCSGNRPAAAGETPPGFPPASEPLPAVDEAAAPTQATDPQDSAMDLSVVLLAVAAVSVVGVIVLVAFRGISRRRQQG